MLRTLVEENQNTKKELQRKLTKTNKEVVVWKSKYETDAVTGSKSLNFSCTIGRKLCTIKFRGHDFEPYRSSEN